MQAYEIMTQKPVYCTPETSLWEVARLMAANYCGAVPVVENAITMKLVGIVTDRDITCRAVAQGKNPLEMTAAECMSAPVATTRPGTAAAECGKIMERNHIRRLVVTDEKGGCLGIISQSDLAVAAPEYAAMAVIREASHHNVPARARMTK